MMTRSRMSAMSSSWRLRGSGVWRHAAVPVLSLVFLGCPDKDTHVLIATGGPPQAVASSDSGPGSRVPRWDVTIDGIGPVRAGMTVTEASKRLGTPLEMLGDSKACDYARPTNASPDSLLFMVVDSQVARVDVRGTAVATVEGARIGDSEARIESLYSGRVTVQPHKYTAGHYLVVRSPTASDTTHRIIFETDGKVVTRFRSGRMPEVAWVEGCS